MLCWHAIFAVWDILCIPQRNSPVNIRGNPISLWRLVYWINIIVQEDHFTTNSHNKTTQQFHSYSINQSLLVASIWEVEHWLMNYHKFETEWLWTFCFSNLRVEVSLVFSRRLLLAIKLFRLQIKGFAIPPAPLSSLFITQQKFLVILPLKSKG